MELTRKCLKCKEEKHFSSFTCRVNGKEQFRRKCQSCFDKYRAKCVKCEKEKPKSDFHKMSSQKNGVRPQCKACRGFAEHVEYTTFFEKNKDEIYHKRKARTAIDPVYKMANLLRTRLSLAIKRKKWNKISPFSEYIGCDLETLKRHIESKFKPGMTWKNHTLKGWHLDHIIPLSSAKTVEELEKLCHYTNLQPLWYHENISKRAKIQSLG